MNTESEARIGKLYIDLYKAKSRLEKRRHEGKRLVDTLRELADCLDEEIPDCQILETRDGQFKSSRTATNFRSGESEFVRFPTEAETVATDICELRSQIDTLEKELELELRCL